MGTVIDNANAGKQIPAGFEICDLSTLLTRNPSLHNVLITPDQEDRLMAQFDHYGIVNTQGYFVEEPREYLPFLDCAHVYVTDTAQDYFECCKSNAFQFLEVALAIHIHHLTNGGKG